MKLAEKLGGALSSHNQMQLFRDVIDECGFMDLGYMSTNLTGVNIFKMDILFGRGWIRVWPQAIGS